MKKKYLLLMLIGATAFATSTGEANLKLDSHFDYDVAGNKLNKTYTLPYDFKVNYDDLGISFGLKDGKSNDGNDIGDFYLSQNKGNLWASYNFDVAPQQNVTLKTENMINIDKSGVGTIGTQLSGMYKYDVSSDLQYTGTLSYKGEKLLFDANQLAFNNNVKLNGDYELNLNLTNNFGTTNKFTVDVNGSVEKFGVKVEPGYKLFVNTDTATKSTTLSNEAKLDLSYSQDFNVAKVDLSLGNTLSFNFTDISKDLEYTMNPKLVLSRSFDVESLKLDGKLTVDNKLTVKGGKVDSNNLKITPYVGNSITLSEKAKLNSGLGVDFVVDGTSFKSINTNFTLGFNYKW